jgi:hypothetical protein
MGRMLAVIVPDVPSVPASSREYYLRGHAGIENITFIARCASHIETRGIREIGFVSIPEFV